LKEVFGKYRGFWNMREPVTITSIIVRPRTMVAPRFSSIPSLLGLLFFAPASGSTKISAAGLGFQGIFGEKPRWPAKFLDLIV
jgi:hypothetical protein